MPAAILLFSLALIFADCFLLFGYLNAFAIAASFGVASGLALLAHRGQLLADPAAPSTGKFHFRITILIPILAALLGLIGALRLLWKFRIWESVQSPFEQLPPVIFFVLALGLFGALTVWLLRSKFSQATGSLALFVFLGLLALCFPLTYGFDPLLHQAAEKAVLATGAISTIPILYGGLYALVASLGSILPVSIAQIDRFLVPTLAALCLPMIAPWPVWLLAPLGFFTLTTPFSLAAILFLVVLHLAVFSDRKKQIWLGVPVAVAAILAHPLAGIPALFVLCAGFFKNKIAVAACLLLQTLAIPGLLFFRSFQSGQPAQVTWSPAQLLKLLPDFKLETTYRVFQDLAYLSGAAIAAIFVIALGSKIYHSWREQKVWLPLTIAFSLILSGAALQFLTLPEIIYYEQGEFGARLVWLAMIVLIMVAAEPIAKKLRQQFTTEPRLIAITALISFTILAACNWYLIYPRRDRHEVNHGWNASMFDFKAAEIVTQDAIEPFVLLAPQTNSAAFIQAYGFPETLSFDDTEILPYPLPTGGKLYPYFLEMSSSPSVDTLRKVRML
ncbi:MAG: hypothetical protein V1821_03565, partial [bacterium]